jgi:nitric oxide dioxygenase
MQQKEKGMDTSLLVKSFHLATHPEGATHEEAEQISLQFAETFYTRLFQQYPQAQTLFTQRSTDMKRQYRMLMGTLAYVVTNVGNSEKLIPAVQALGRRHTRYKVKPEHYVMVGAALIETFQERLGSRYTKEMHDSWVDAYDLLSKTMIEAV